MRRTDLVLDWPRVWENIDRLPVRRERGVGKGVGGWVRGGRMSPVGLRHWPATQQQPIGMRRSRPGLATLQFLLDDWICFLRHSYWSANAFYEPITTLYGLTGFLPGFSRKFFRFYGVLLGCTGFCRFSVVWPSFDGVSSSVTGFNWVLLGFTGFERVSMGLK